MQVEFDNQARKQRFAGLIYSQQVPSNILHGWHADTVVGSYDVEGLAKKCVDMCCEFANMKIEQL